MSAHKVLECPNCHAPYFHLTVIDEPGKRTVTCRQCGEEGTVAYFTPGPALDTEPRLISREVHVDDEKVGTQGQGAVKALSAAMALLGTAAFEEGLDIRWHTMRIAGARDEAAATTTFVAVVQAVPRAPHDRGGAASGLGDKIAVQKSDFNWTDFMRPEDIRKDFGIGAM